MKRFFLAPLVFAAVGVSALAGTAAAADLQPAGSALPYKAAPAPAYTWGGLYIGVNGGDGWGRSAWDSSGGFGTAGGIVGGTIGYNYPIGGAVLGVEGDIDWSRIKGGTTTFVCPLGCQTSDTWLSTIRGRLGYAADRFMPFVTAGGAFGDIRASAPGLIGSSTNNAGWTVGGGLDFALAGNWTAKVEYLYVDLGKFNCGLGCGAAAINNVSFTANIVRGGINYRF